MTCKEVCKVIEESEVLVDKDGNHPTAKEIWNYSPTGELYMLTVWYEMALIKNKEMES